MQANAIVAVDPKTVAIRSVEIGEIGPWDILVEIEYSAISVGTETYIASTVDPADPRVLGYGPVSRVVRVGEKAGAHYAVGERVTYFCPRRPLNHAQNCGGHQSPAVLFVNPAERDLLAPNSYVVKVPSNVPSDLAAFAGISAVSYLGTQMPNPAPGDKVAIFGQGIIGLFATQHFALRGAQVMSLDLDEKRLAAARVCGADITANTGGGADLAKAVRERWPAGADIVVDATASHRVVEASIGALRPEGRYVFLGYYKGPDFHLGSVHGVVFNGFFPWTLRGPYVAASLKLMSMGVLKVAELISHRHGVSEAPKVFETIRSKPGQHLGILLDWRK